MMSGAVLALAGCEPAGQARGDAGVLATDAADPPGEDAATGELPAASDVGADVASDDAGLASDGVGLDEDALDAQLAGPDSGEDDTSPDSGEPDAGPLGGDDAQDDATGGSGDDDATGGDAGAVDDAGDAAAEVEDAGAIEDTTTVDAGPGDAVVVPLPPCEPPLASRAERWVGPRSATRVTVTGGTGRYRHRLVAAPSGGIVQGSTGEYISGPTAPVIDVVETTDLGCEGRTETRVNVAAALEALPAIARVASGGRFRPVVRGGSGVWDLTIVEGGTGDGRVVAPPEDVPWLEATTVGTVRLEVVDSRTGQQASVAVTVTTDVVPAADPPRVVAPLGTSWPVRTLDTSGFTEVVRETFVPAEGGPQLVPRPDGAVWSADGTGRAAIVLQDLCLDTPFGQDVEVVDGFGPAPVVQGQVLDRWAAHAPGDIDGDGRADLILGAPELASTHLQSGTVQIWRGREGGLQPETPPDRVIAGETRAEHFGQAVATGDFDDDGLRDLAIGASGFRNFATGVTAGRVVVYPGVEGALFGDTPVTTLQGTRGSDLFGFALAACDFNGDGYSDLAVGAYDHEDATASPVTNSQGAVHLVAGGPAGLGSTPTQTVFGAIPVEGVWQRQADLAFGRTLAAGDLDGDGACDLAVGSHLAAGGDGYVWILRGDDAGAGLVSPIPVAVWKGAETGRFGHALAIGDLDGDDLADLAVGQPYYAKTGVVADNHGGVRVKRGGPWLGDAASAILGDADFDVLFTGPGQASADTNDEFGFRVEIGDVTGDERADLVVTGIVDELACTGCVASAGAVHLFPGRADGWPAALPTAGVTSGVASDRVGIALAISPALDVTATPRLFAVAARDDSAGPDAGLALVADFATATNVTGSARVGLRMQISAGGWRTGAALAGLPDLDGDGLPELAVGSPFGSSRVSNAMQLQNGLVTIHRGTPDGHARDAFQTLSAFRRNSGSDRAGHDLATLRDFDGDGRPDLAVVARSEDMAATYGTGHESPPACNVAGTDTGAVLVFNANAGGGLDAEPSFVHFLPQASQVTEAVTSADFDGDGLSDLIVASRLQDRSGASNTGAVEVVPGRARSSGGVTTVSCAAAFRLMGLVAEDGYGAAVAALGDLDDDGCDDIAVGIPGADWPSLTNVGAVEVVFGAGARCRTATVRRAMIQGLGASTQFGLALHAVDLDGDGRRELAVGGPFWRPGSVTGGGAWVVSGARLAALAAVAAPREDATPSTMVTPVAGASGLGGASVVGLASGEALGTAVVLVPPNPAAPRDAGPLLAVAVPEARLEGAIVGGVVRVFAVTVDGTGEVRIAVRATLVVPGEAHLAMNGVRLAATAASGRAGRRLILGLPESHLVGVASGATVAFDLDKPPPLPPVGSGP